MKVLVQQDQEIITVLQREEARQRDKIVLIASENYASRAVREVQGSVLTNKYAEGYPGRRYYGGCEEVDKAERLAIERVKKLYGAEHANVQPHSGTQANMAVYFAMLQPGDTVLAMNLAHGGHLSHGSPVSFSGKFYHFLYYGVNKETEQIDYNEVEQIAREHKPKLIVTGASSYPRIIDFERFHHIADSVGACLMADIAHIAGLVAVGEHPSPLPHAPIVTSTTQKTLRGPRGGFILCHEEFTRRLDSTVFPGIQGGPMMHVIAAKAVAFHEALQSEFIVYQQSIRENARILADELHKLGFRMVTGGTDNHIVLVDLREQGITGKSAEDALDAAGISVNRNVIPFEPLPPRVTSGIRLGTPAVTTRGFGPPQMRQIARLIHRVLTHIGEEKVTKEVREETESISANFPIP